MPAVDANTALYNAALRHHVQLLRFAEGQAQAVAAALKGAEDELLAKITTAMAKGLDATRLEALLKSVKELRAEVYTSIGQDATEALQGLAETEADWEVEALKGAAPVQLNLAAVPLETVHATVASPIAGVPLEGWLENIAAKEVLSISQAVTQAVIQGETIDDLVRRIRGSKAADYADGILSMSTRNATALARTAVNHVSNAARETVWQANKDVVRVLRWTATLDGRTSAICASRDGHMAPVDPEDASKLLPEDQPLVPPGARPPAHFNCRSVMVPVLDGVELAGDRPFVADARTRKEREAAFRREAKERGVPIAQVRQEWADEHVGRVPSGTTYQDWLKTQPPEFQDEVLGKGKAELFRSGVPLERFFDASGKALSLEELKAEVAGDALNVLQPAIGTKAKGLLMQGLHPDEVLAAIKNEFPDAKTTLASIASYKSELNKAGLLDAAAKPTFSQMYQALGAQGELDAFEGALAPGLKAQLGGQWATVVDALDGHPGAYAHYKPGVGVQLADGMLSGLSKAQAQQVMAHELGHYLHKVHGLGDTWLEHEGTNLALKTLDLPPEIRKLYSYYMYSQDELWGEIVGQAIHPSPVTSQGMAAGPFSAHFADEIALAKNMVKAKFPDDLPALNTGPVVQGAGEIAGKPTSIGGYAKALLQQGMADQEVLDAVLAEFPNAKTTMNSIKSYKSELKKAEQAAIGKPGPTVEPQMHPKIDPEAPPAPPAPKGVADPAAELPKPSPDAVPLGGLTKVGGKPGGSNPGAVFADAKGDQWLVKGNAQKVGGKVAADVSDARARNEVLAARLLRLADPGIAPEMKLVDLEGQYGGGQGVMSRMLDKPIVKFDPKSPAHVAIAQKDFALHAWLGNWDVVGADFDNLVMKGGKAVNIDPGGALMFRAQGLPKDLLDFDGSVDEWNTMRKGTKNPNAKAVYGSMTDDQLKESAKQLLKFTDDVIAEQVEAMNPGIPLSDKELIDVLIERRDDILKRVGLEMPKPAAPVTPVTPPTFSAADGVPVNVKEYVKAELAKEIDAESGLASTGQEAYLKELNNKLDGEGIDYVLTEEQFQAIIAEKQADDAKMVLAKFDGLSDFQKDALKKAAADGYKVPLPGYDGVLDYVNSQWSWLPSKVTQADLDAIKAGAFDGTMDANLVAKAVPPVVHDYAAMTAQQLADAVVPSDLEIKTWYGKTKASYIIQKAAAELFKTGINTQKVHDALVAKFGNTFVPKTTSLASMKSKLKKLGLLEGKPGEAAAKTAGLKQPKLWGQALGHKSSGVKEQAKLMIPNKSAKEVTDWIATQFSSPNPQGAQDLYELAYYEVQTGKTYAKPGVGSTYKHAAQLPEPVPLRPATKVGEAGPPPPRFDAEGRRAGLQKYGGQFDEALLAKINKRQVAAGLEPLEIEELAAIKAYTNSAYQSVNSNLRSGMFSHDLYLQAWTDAAMHGLYKLPPWKGVVKRGMRVSESQVKQLKMFYRPGSVVEETQFTSTANAETGGSFGGNVRYTIHAKTGRDVKPISSHKGENEIMMLPGTKFRVMHVKDTHSGIEIEMEEVG